MKSFHGSLWATVLIMSAVLLSGCNTTKVEAPAVETRKATPTPAKQVYHYTSKDRECLKRAMYFESKRTSRNGFMAVGTVVMNRLTSGAYPDTICDVVAQKNQFAPGVMTRIMDEATAPDLEGASEAILKGERHPEVKDAMFFHTNGLKFPYKNMSYVAVAGGNAFYEKRGRDGELQTPEPLPTSEYFLAFADPANPVSDIPMMNEAPVQVASAAADATASSQDQSPAVSEPELLPTPQLVGFEPLPAITPLPSPRPGRPVQQASLRQSFIYR